MAVSKTQIKTWGNGLAVRLPKAAAKLAGFDEGTRVRIAVAPGRIVVEAEVKPTLEQMLAAFDPVRHGGEVLTAVPVGREAIRATTRNAIAELEAKKGKRFANVDALMADLRTDD